MLKMVTLLRNSFLSYVLFNSLVFLSFVLPACSPDDPDSMDTKVLVFSKTAGFRHASIESGIQMIKDLAAVHDFEVLASEDASVFKDSVLQDYQVVIFLSTTGNILNRDQEEAFVRFIQSGGGFVGIHAATDTEYDWAWYNGLVGAYFDGHPAIQTATVQKAAVAHSSTNHLPEEWIREDEWYNFRDVQKSLQILLRVDERTYQGGTMSDDHPISWFHEYDGGRAWYTGMGHTEASFRDSLFRDHVWGGILYALGGD